MKEFEGTPPVGSKEPSVQMLGALDAPMQRFRLRKELGRGASARVFLADDTLHGGTVALKVFHPFVAGDAGLLERVLRESSIATMLKHPNVVDVREVARGEGAPILVMEPLDGENLSILQPKLPYTLPELSVRVLCDALRGIAVAHALGVIHRDLKPENIVVTDAGRVVVTDFGLAKILGRVSLTKTNHWIGTPDYIAPELARGEPPSERSDVFSLSSLLYFLVTGTKPFRRSSPVATIAALQNDPAEPPLRRNPKISPNLSALILRGLRKDPRERFASADAFRQELENYLHAVGLDPEQFDVPRWRQDPTGYVSDAIDTMGSKLAARAERQLDAADQVGLMETLSQLSLVAPHTPVLDRLLAESRKLAMRPRVQRRRLAIWLVVIFVLGTIGIGVTHTMRKRPIDSANANATPVVAPDKSSPQPVAALVPAPELIAEPAPKVSKALAPPSAAVTAAKPPVKKGRVVFDLPEGVGVQWDGKTVNPANPIENVVVGPHKLRLKMPGYDAVDGVVRVQSGRDTTIRAR